MNLTGLDTKAVAFGDYDDDGDIDLALANDTAPVSLYTNLERGKIQGHCRGNRIVLRKE